MLWGVAAAIVAATIAGIVLVASQDDPSDGATGSNTTLPAVPSEVTTLPDTALVPTTVAATAVPATTLPATTLPTTAVPQTTVPPATTAPTPDAPAIPEGWSPAEFIEQAFPPAFEGNWIGAPSPPIVDRSGPLPDGVYAASYVRQDASTLELEIRRFETCDVLGESRCFPGPYAPNEVGISDVLEGTVAIPLDTSTRVIISGWECDQIVGQGNGADLSAIYGAISQDYDAAFGPGLAAGTEPSMIVENVRASPVGGFGIPACDDGYSLEWRFGEAPPVLVQWPFDWETDDRLDPATLLVPTVIEVNGSNTTVYLYAGFYS